jgi:hypothetical protein
LCWFTIGGIGTSSSQWLVKNEDEDAIDPSEAGREEEVSDDPPTLCSHAMILFRKFYNI